MKVSVERKKTVDWLGCGKDRRGKVRVSVFADSESHFSPRQRGRGKVGGVMGSWVTVSDDFFVEILSLFDNFFCNGGGVEFVVKCF
ncbi:hypothetical protein NPIL_232001 [Nephila pilipes]|uniref:Uncharacterized protein n=1 Tax=Nephila pilipes TaxID=299642 RepID=A0A8X6QZ85_NEPPI|nr:hypothetical protein NPIL_232001 [Nephila pilipes]